MDGGVAFREHETYVVAHDAGSLGDVLMAGQKPVFQCFPIEFQLPVQSLSLLGSAMDDFPVFRTVFRRGDHRLPLGEEAVDDVVVKMVVVVVRDEKGVAAVCNAVRDFQGESGPFLGTEIYCHCHGRGLQHESHVVDFEYPKPVGDRFIHLLQDLLQPSLHVVPDGWSIVVD